MQTYEVERISRKRKGRAARRDELHSLKKWRQRLKQCQLCGQPSKGRTLCTDCGGENI
jgi:hypothetical protein